MPSWRNGRRAGLKHLWETVPVRVRHWVQTPKKGNFFWSFLCKRLDTKFILL